MLIKNDLIFGLTPKEVELRVKEGKVNTPIQRKTKTYKEIFFHNIFSVFNLIIVILAILVAPTIKSISDITNYVFVLIAFINLTIGIVQEIKAKKIVDSLVLVNEPTVKVLRELHIDEIKVSDIVLDDILFLEAEKQISADSKVMKGELYVNESNITGESDDILKKPGDELYSGSYVVSGEAYAKVIHVSKDNYIEKLSSQATTYSKPKSEIMKVLNTIITTISILLLPLSVMLFFVYKNYSSFEGDAIIFGMSRELILGLASAINAMMPYGLFLLTTIAFATSIFKLASQKTLVQELYCIESLARVDVLCLDKTGTLTDGTMKVTDTTIVNPNYSVIEILSSMNASLKNTNATSRALVKKYGRKAYFEPQKVLNFNSTNKYSAVTFKTIGTFAIGAPEVLLNLKEKKNKDIMKDINKIASLGSRVIVLCKSPGKIKDNKVDSTFEVIAYVSIHDNLRNGVNNTLTEFRESGVEIKVISGDNPVTVSAIAKDAGIINHDKYISLAGLSDDEVRKAALEYTIFGRVKPNQKKIIIQTLKQKGHKVAMTGDGVNDILALKEADCSIAMASGSEAVSTVAHLVLLDSNFLSLPSVVNEGRRVINNIQRATALFLTKTFLMGLINLFAVIMFFINKSSEFTSPFKEPGQLFLIETFITGLASFVMAIEPNHERIEGKFFKNVFSISLPIALIIFMNLLVIHFKADSFGLTVGEATNISILLTTYIYFMCLFVTSIPFSKIRKWISAIIAVMLILAPFVSIFTIQTSGFDLCHFSFIDGKLDFGVEGFKMMGFLFLIDILLLVPLIVSRILYFKNKNKYKVMEV